ncbi:methylthioribulose 1-phosphate dehydratase [Ammoniphilus sp. CFH 90114]|uniref:methylthioribulose 1-phosphate dehydratase n=1 Tax=Ammoniphilus sp. CFH 90114 TaxID=2493665 RepID=UPI00100F21F9|nr:methylthioribulose 1-phosphate dehydratase [Ammoniphilus sp. CFH 90114]RXT04841.1 methylthioribulose 1-phosphate dehydratase [Ammoniphilus sp. CFH 90114]
MNYAIHADTRQEIIHSLNEVKQNFANRGWFPGTSGNLSIKVQDHPVIFAVTASGKDKTKITPNDYLFVDIDAKPVEQTNLKPSAETLVHSVVYDKIQDAGAVFHVHTIANNVVSELYGDQGYFEIGNQELIKGLGIWDEGAVIQIPIVENYADIPRLAKEIEKVLNPQIPGVLIRNHGIYAWGRNDFETKRHVEAFEFLFEYHLRLLQTRHLVKTNVLVNS